MKISLITTLSIFTGGSYDTVVARWTAGHQVERSILYIGHDSYQNLSC